MQLVQKLVLIALTIAIVAFLYTGWLRSAKGNARSSLRQEKINAGKALTIIKQLRESQAQWPQILAALNQERDGKIEELLLAIRGPHMFDPRTGLGVLETGCRSVPPEVPFHAALLAAHRSMNVVVHAGR
jgi:hypothetical protein